MPRGLRSRVPPKITSSIRAPRRLLADCSPSTQLIASLILDLPHPFGPTMPAMPSPLNRNSVRSQNDLNPCNSTRLSLSKPLPRWFPGDRHYTKRARHKSKARPPLLIVLHLALTHYLGVDRDGHCAARFSRNAFNPSLKSLLSKTSSRV